MKKMLVTIFFLMMNTLQSQIPIIPSVNRVVNTVAGHKDIACEDLEYRLHLTRTDIELITRIHHESGHKNSLLRELQDNEKFLQNEIKLLGCFK